MFCIVEISDLQKKFIVDEDLYQKEELPKLVERTLQYCTVSKNGMVNIRSPDLSQREKAMLFLTARFLASQMDDSIPAVVRSEEMEGIVSPTKAAVGARMKELVDLRWAERKKGGQFQVRPFYIEQFLKSIEEKVE